MHDIALSIGLSGTPLPNVIRGLPRLSRDISDPHGALKEQQIWN